MIFLRCFSFEFCCLFSFSEILILAFNKIKLCIDGDKIEQINAGKSVKCTELMNAIFVSAI